MHTLRSLRALPTMSMSRHLLQGRACHVSSSCCRCRHRRSPLPLFATPPNPSGKDAMTMTQGDLKPPPITMSRRHCPRMTSRWASSSLIIVVVIVVDVVATLLPSNEVHGVCHGATAGHGTSNNANFGCSGSGCRCILCACCSVVPLEWQSPERKRTTRK
jgi:hypothetical protein